MKIEIVKIGNSRGIRIPKPVLEACAIGDAVELEVKDGKLVLSPVKREPRAGWAEAFAANPPDNDERPLLGDFSNDFDEEEWTW